MKVILLKDHPKLGKKFDIKEVSPGYAKNFLMPKELIMPATKQNIESVNRLKAENKARNEQQSKDLGDLASQLEESKIEIIKKANKEGKLFAGVTEAEIKTAIKASGLSLGKAFKIKIDKHIKVLGIHEIVIDFENKKIPLKLKVKEA
jgi:large subunit ribosomal protein L9